MLVTDIAVLVYSSASLRWGLGKCFGIENVELEAVKMNGNS